MKVKVRHTEHRPSTQIPLPKGFSYAPESELPGAALVIIDHKTQSRYQWLPKKEALDTIDNNLDELQLKVTNEQYQVAKKECEELKAQIAMCRAVFQKINTNGRKSMTFRLV